MHKSNLTSCHLYGKIDALLQTRHSKKVDEIMAMQTQDGDDHNQTPAKRPRLIIDISPELHRRIKIAAAKKDLSIREYVESILDKAVPSEKRERGRLNSAAIEDLLKTREEIMHAHPGQEYDSVETLHQLREERLKELEQ